MSSVVDEKFYIWRFQQRFGEVKDMAKLLIWISLQCTCAYKCQVNPFSVIGDTPRCSWFLGWLNHASLRSHSPSLPGEEPGSGADICKLHFQLLLGCSPQLFCLLGPDASLLPSTSGESGQCGPTNHCCPGPGSRGWTAGTVLTSAVNTVRSRW